MKLRLNCTGCMKSTEGIIQTWMAILPLQAHGPYEWTCPDGHEQSVMLAHAHYEVLAEVALQALVDGYPREAVLSFSGAVERLMEAYVRGVWITQGLAPDAQDQLWKAVSNQSERQVGLFLATWALSEQSGIALVHRKQVEFRNEVVHKGHIPTLEEAITYGQAVIGWLKPVETAGRKHSGWWKQFENQGPSSYKTNFALDLANDETSLRDMIVIRESEKKRLG